MTTGLLDFSITGADKIRRVGAALIEAGRGDLTRELRSGLDRSLDPLEADWRKGLPTYLPDGYAAEINATTKVRRQRLTGKNPLVRLRASASTEGGKDRELRKVDAGQLRHPLPTSRRYWFPQAVKPGMWVQQLREDAPKVRRELERVVNRIVAKLQGVS